MRNVVKNVCIWFIIVAQFLLRSTKQTNCLQLHETRVHISSSFSFCHFEKHILISSKLFILINSLAEMYHTEATIIKGKIGAFDTKIVINAKLLFYQTINILLSLWHEKYLTYMSLFLLHYHQEHCVCYWRCIWV